MTSEKNNKSKNHEREIILKDNIKQALDANH